MRGVLPNDLVHTHLPERQDVLIWNHAAADEDVPFERPVGRKKIDKAW